MKTIKILLALSSTFLLGACGSKKVTEMGDTVIIDFTGTINGVKFKGGSANDYTLVLGSNNFIKGFEEQLVGYSRGEWVEVKVKFPDNYRPTHLAGAEAKFETKIEKIIKKK